MTSVFDFLLLVGLCLMSVGIWQVYPPATFIFVGLVLCGVAVAGVRNGAASEPDRTSRE